MWGEIIPVTSTFFILLYIPELQGERGREGAREGGTEGREREREREILWQMVHQAVNHVECWLLRSGMQAKIPKCHSLAIHTTSGRTYDPMLTLHGNSLPDIGNISIKFLGAYIQIPPDHNRMRDHLMSKLNSLLNKVNSVPVSRQQKLFLYRAAICPRLLWDLGISDLPMSWVTKCLEATATYFLKTSSLL